MSRIQEIIQRLNKEYGSPSSQSEDDAIYSLIRVILSQNTNDKNRERAFSSLTTKFSNPEEIMNAPEKEIADSISVAGLQNIKANRIKGSLEKIKEEKEEFSLDFLENKSLEESKRWLKGLPGVGPKSAAVILNFDFDKNAFPVDTHVFRVSKRIGLIPEDFNREKAHDLLEEQTPDEKMEEFHLNLIRHGREICKAPNPVCEECFLTDFCDYYEREHA